MIQVNGSVHGSRNVQQTYGATCVVAADGYCVKGDAAFVIGIAKNEHGINHVFFKRGDNDELETMIFVDLKTIVLKLKTLHYVKCIN